MQGREFFELAVQLSNGSRPSETRSSVSRAYYGAFHVAREFVHTECRVALPPDATAHKKLHELFEACGLAILVTVGRRLASLREARNYADYRLDHRASSLQSNSIEKILIAKEIIEAIETGLGGTLRPTAISEIRANAQSVFRMIVR